jgi:hypothetical protein
MPDETASEDAVLGGRLVLRQPLRGHRVGHDAILLAAATSAASGDHAVDLGSGVGGAGLALARRIEDLNVTLVEVDPVLTELAAGNAQRNGLSDRVRAVRLDVESSAADFIAAGLAPGSAACVLMNPPFNIAQQPSPDYGRRLAHAATEATLERWLRGFCAPTASSRWFGAPTVSPMCLWRSKRISAPSPCCRSTPSRAQRRSACWRAQQKEAGRRWRCCRVFCSPMPMASRPRRPKPSCAKVKHFL